ncbi:MAG TPA: hypothetical protein VGL70_20340 [Candidatus Binatia bacterium]
MRKDIDLFGEDKYGHWWIEVGPKESYGWWPKKPVGISETLFGTDGDLNGKYWGGTATMDVHHGDRGPGVNVFNVYGDPSISTQSYIEQIRSFANSYRGGWSWPIGQNCHSFQQQMLQKLGLTVRPVGE